ncbi:MAG: CinA family protein [Bdellovibrionaceae bacterium]|nr:CinA family protein [Pseudobdellovibrionaceae bacterium]MDW8189558.1 CinA family protein [Pseudobdellovibrionaceae bacterium]
MLPEADRVVSWAIKHKTQLGIAESCTGGQVTAFLTQVPGCSQALWGSLVVYSNQAKTELLKVPQSLIQEHGAVSEEVVHSMANQMLSLFPIDLAVAISGIAGPSGGSTQKPVGTVWFALAMKGRETVSARQLFQGNREQIIHQSAVFALRFILERTS